MAVKARMNAPIPTGLEIRCTENPSTYAPTPKIDDQRIPPAALNKKEARPRHAIDTGEQSGSRAQQSDKSSEEDDCASVTAKEVLPELDPPLVETDAGPIACYERKSYDPTDPVPDVVADHRAGARSSNNAHHIKIVARTGVNRSGN